MSTDSFIFFHNASGELIYLFIYFLIKQASWGVCWRFLGQLQTSHIIIRILWPLFISFLWLTCSVAPHNNHLDTGFSSIISCLSGLAGLSSAITFVHMMSRQEKQQPLSETRACFRQEGRLREESCSSLSHSTH